MSPITNVGECPFRYAKPAGSPSSSASQYPSAAGELCRRLVLDTRQLGEQVVRRSLPLDLHDLDRHNVTTVVVRT
jgi:hypothetical protein